MTSSVWHGAYFDGRSPARDQADIRLMSTGLEIRLSNGSTHWWRYRDIRQTQGFYAGEEIRLERGESMAETLVIGDQAFLAALHEAGAEAVGRFHNPAQRPWRIRLVICAAVLVVAAAAAAYQWGIPALAAAVAPHVPVSWEERLGQGVLEQLAAPPLQCRAPDQTRIIDQIEARLLSTRTDQPLTFRVIVIDEPIVNAVAVPGGTIVVYRGLLDKTKNAEELAGVLAHETQHVLLRHTTQQLLQQASTGLLITAMTGDATGAAAFGLRSAAMIGMLRYSREHEAEADLEGMKMLLAAGVDPHGMLTFFETLKQDGADVPDALKYLNNHPQTEARIRTLSRYAQEHPINAAPLFPEFAWKRMRDVCGRTPARNAS
ncbi:MAG TPA: M48 family metallopeptidase [Nitrospiria bacterium]|nr:M48 family metallopeptidase [Nitrospiria bacterium]